MRRVQDLAGNHHFRIGIIRMSQNIKAYALVATIERKYCIIKVKHGRVIGIHTLQYTVLKFHLVLFAGL